MQVLGVYEKDLIEPLTEVLNNLGVKSAMVVYGLDVMDEISTSAKTAVCEIKNGKTMSYEISPEYFDMEFSSKDDLVGGDAKENAKELVCPPYDIISDEQRKALLNKNEHNLIRLELPRGENPYKDAAKILKECVAQNVAHDGTDQCHHNRQDK